MNLFNKGPLAIGKENKTLILEKEITFLPEFKKLPKAPP